MTALSVRAGESRRTTLAGPRPRPDAGPDVTTLSRARALLELQRGAGNAAVARLVELGTPLQAALPGVPTVQRSGGDAGACSGGECALTSTCATPDPGHEGSEVASTRWELELNIDTAASSWEWALRNQSFGHAFVRFWETNGRQYTYGFYPADVVPTENRRSVPGCVHHPDVSHDDCVDDVVGYTLTQAQYDAGREHARSVCASGATYGQEYTCVTFAADVARAAGQSPPATRSEPTTVFSQPVPGIDNPNTLAEAAEASRTITDDDGARAWVTAQDVTTLDAVPTAEAVRLIRLLLGGLMVVEEDVLAVERLCAAKTTSEQLSQIAAGVAGSVDAMWSSDDQARVTAALHRAP